MSKKWKMVVMLSYMCENSIAVIKSSLGLGTFWTMRGHIRGLNHMSVNTEREGTLKKEI